MTATFTSEQLFVQPTALSRWDIKTSAKTLIPVNHDRAVMMNLIAMYNYYLSHLKSPAVVWITSKINNELVNLAKDILGNVEIVVVSTAQPGGRRQRRGQESTVDLPTAIKSLKEAGREICLFWSDSLSELNDEKAIAEIVTRTKIIDDVKPRYFVTEFKWYTPRITIEDGQLPPRYVEFFGGHLFKTPWLDQSSNYVVTIIGTSDELVNYDWYDIYGKLAYHTHMIRISNRYRFPIDTDVRKATLTIQTPKIYEEYSNQWDATAELRLLADLTDSNLNDMAAISTAITTATSTPVADNSVYNLYQRLVV